MIRHDLKSIPSNYRRVKRDDCFRPGDLFYYANAPTQIHEADWKGQASSFRSAHFFRKRVRPTKPADSSQLGLTTKETSTNKNVVMVRFQYPDSQYHFLRERDVQLISMDATHIVGLEQSLTRRDNGKWKWQFKKYLRNKIPYNGVVLTHYGVPIK